MSSRVGSSSVAPNPTPPTPLALQVSDASAEVAVPVDVLGVHYLPSANPFAGGGQLSRVPSSPSGPAAPVSAQLVSNARAARQLKDGRHVGTGVIASVEHHKGVKSLTLQSTVSVSNDSGLPLLVVFEVAATAPTASGAAAAGESASEWRARRGSVIECDGGRTLHYRRIVMPGDELVAPLHATASGSLRVAPILPGYAHPDASPDALLHLRSVESVDEGDAGGVGRQPVPLDHITPYALSAPIDLRELQVRRRPFVVVFLQAFRAHTPLRTCLYCSDRLSARRTCCTCRRRKAAVR